MPYRRGKKFKRKRKRRKMKNLLILLYKVILLLILEWRNRKQSSSQLSGQLLNPSNSKTRGGKKSKFDTITIDQLIKESKISAMVSKSIIKKVLIIIFAMLIVMPLISDDFYTYDDSNCYTLLADYLSYYLANGTNAVNYNETYLENVLYSISDVSFPIINITFNGNMFYHNSTNTAIARNFRSNEMEYTASKLGDIVITYSNYVDTSINGILSVFKTVYICILLALAAFVFENDAKELILQPLEVIVEIVENVSKDPIAAKNIQAVEENTKAGLLATDMDTKNLKIKKAGEIYEAKVIKSAILKISALLAICFGEAGGEIIKENLTNNQDLNPMLPGKRKEAIFGFCDIRNFPIINQALQEKTMVFVNEVADIVHSIVDRFGGAANKNIGDAFLLVWRLSNVATFLSKKKSSIFESRRDNRISVASINFKMITTQIMADLSVLAFLKIIIRINKDRRILAYQNEPKIITSLPGYKVNMGFGLHIGWATEGAVGSLCKIDASYLSPNVNMAARLEAATRQYGVTFLISGELYDQLSRLLKVFFRHIDTVEVKGSKIPLRLYTIDVNLDLKPSKRTREPPLREKLQRYADKKTDLLCDIEEFGSVTEYILSKKSFRELLKNARPKKFRKYFEKGIKNYIGGFWKKAKHYFEKSLKKYDDSPTKFVLEFMEKYDYEAPKDWCGYRSLTSK
jgi:class 3 adenylate cyclase